MKYPPQISANFRQAKVIVIESNYDHWILIRQAMQECLPEVEVVWVSSVQQAIVQFKVWENQEWEMPKLIMLDLYLPNSEDGWQLLSYIKDLKHSLRQVPILILSSSSNDSNITRAYQQGVASYSVKPSDYLGWLQYFQESRKYWWETVTLPPTYYGS